MSFFLCAGLKRVAWPPPNDSEEYIEQEPVHSQVSSTYCSILNCQQSCAKQMKHYVCMFAMKKCMKDFGFFLFISVLSGFLLIVFCYAVD